MKRLIAILFLAGTLLPMAAACDGGIYDENICLEHGQYLDNSDHTCYNYSDIPQGDQKQVISDLADWYAQQHGITKKEALEIILAMVEQQ